MRYALVHDLAEVYAGDTPTIGEASRVHGGMASKKEREAQAVERIRAEWQEPFPDLLAALDAYDRKEDAEAKLVYALDKILPKLNNLEDGGRNWRIFNHATFDEIVAYTDPKVAVSPAAEKVWAVVRAELEAHPELFTPAEKPL